jgi:hypothetical protein
VSAVAGGETALVAVVVRARLVELAVVLSWLRAGVGAG